MLLGISVILIFFRFSTLIAFPDAHTLDRDQIQKILPGQTFSQQFIADRDTLQTIQILMKGPGIKKGDTIIAKLADDTCVDTLRENVLEASFLNSDNLYLFTFPRIADSKEKKYCLLITFQEENHSSKYLQFFTTRQDNATLLLMNTATNEPLNGQSLSLRAVYRNDSLWQDLAELNARISQYKPWFLKNIFIGTIAILFVTLSIALVAALIHLNIKGKK